MRRVTCKNWLDFGGGPDHDLLVLRLHSCECFLYLNTWNHQSRSLIALRPDAAVIGRIVQNLSHPYGRSSSRQIQKILVKRRELAYTVAWEGRRSWGLRVSWPLWKYVGGVLTAPKMSHSFIQNCCWITLQVSHHQGRNTCVKNGR